MISKVASALGGAETDRKVLRRLPLAILAVGLLLPIMWFVDNRAELSDARLADHPDTELRTVAKHWMIWQTASYGLDNIAFVAFFLVLLWPLRVHPKAVRILTLILVAGVTILNTSACVYTVAHMMRQFT